MQIDDAPDPCGPLHQDRRSPMEHRRLVQAVQRNCDRVDAMRARDRSLCTYLLGMREYYRWQIGSSAGTVPDKNAVGGWIAQREEQWDRLLEGGAGSQWEALPLASGIAPFDESCANRNLAGSGLVYGAGVGRFGAPVFFLARLGSTQLRDRITVVFAEEELARGFDAPPAVSRNDTIIIRRDALRRWLWTRKEMAANPAGGSAFGLALREYERASSPDAAIDAMVDGETETLVLHELGEIAAGRLLGEQWHAMLAASGSRHAELVLRAIRDLMADSLVTLPTLISRNARASLEFWFANLDGARRVLGAKLLAAKSPHRQGIDIGMLEEQCRDARDAWRALAESALLAWRRDGADGVERFARHIVPG